MEKRMDAEFDDVAFLSEIVPVELGRAFGQASLIGSKPRGLTGSNASGNAQDGGGSGNWNVFKTTSS